jgi:hypothetical protein
MPIIIDCETCGRKLRIPDDLMGQPVKCPTCGHVFQFSSEQAPYEEPPARPAAPTDVPRPPRTSVPPVPTLDPAGQRSRAGGFGYVQVSEDTADPPSPGRRPPAPLPQDRERSNQDRGLPPRMTECPFCGEIVPESARRCSRCLEWIEEDPRWNRRPPAERRDVEPHRGGLVLFLGITGLVMGLTVFLIPVAWIPGLAAWILGQTDLNRINRGLVESSGYGTTQAGWICGIIATCLWGLSSLTCLGWLTLRSF